jgi:hypothetical protein
MRSDSGEDQERKLKQKTAEKVVVAGIISSQAEKAKRWRAGGLQAASLGAFDVFIDPEKYALFVSFKIFCFLSSVRLVIYPFLRVDSFHFILLKCHVD